MNIWPHMTIEERPYRRNRPKIQGLFGWVLPLKLWRLVDIGFKDTPFAWKGGEGWFAILGGYPPEKKQ